MSSDSSETNEIITAGRRSTRTVSRRAASNQQSSFQQSKRSDRRMSVSTEQTDADDDDTGYSNSEEEEVIHHCQSCQIKTEQLEKVPVNLHHLDDTFYCADATESANVKSSISKVLSAEDGHSNIVAAVEMGVKEMVSTEPTTMAIPDDYVVLCKVCLTRFKKQRLICDECNYVPRIDERFMRECCRCFEGFISKC